MKVEIPRTKSREYSARRLVACTRPDSARVTTIESGNKVGLVDDEDDDDGDGHEICRRSNSSEMKGIRRRLGRSKQDELSEEKSRLLGGLAPCLRGISLGRIGMEGRELSKDKKTQVGSGRLLGISKADIRSYSENNNSPAQWSTVRHRADETTILRLDEIRRLASLVTERKWAVSSQRRGGYLIHEPTGASCVEVTTWI